MGDKENIFLKLSFDLHSRSSYSTITGPLPQTLSFILDYQPNFSQLPSLSRSITEPNFSDLILLLIHIFCTQNFFSLNIFSNEFFFLLYFPPNLFVLKTILDPKPFLINN